MFSRRIPSDLEPNEWSAALARRQRSGSRLLDLTESNPTRVGLSGAGSEELGALADPRGARYEPDPRGGEEAREVVARAFGRGVVVARDVVLTTGTSESYAHLFRLLAAPGDVVLVPAPSYPLFEPIARVEGVRVAIYRLRYDGRWHLDLGSMHETFDRNPGLVRAVVVVQPNVPTGSCWTPEDIEGAEQLCARHDVALISDEVFGPFSFGNAPLPSLLGRRRVPTFVLGGLSKSCGMPQLKLGWILIAGPEEMRERCAAGLEWIADLFLSVATPVQLALPRLLEARHGYTRRVGERLAANRARLDAFTSSHPETDRLHAEGGWNAILRLPARRSGESWAIDLVDRDVVVHPGHFYDMEGEAYIVVSLLPESASFDEGLDRLGTLLQAR